MIEKIKSKCSSFTKKTQLRLRIAALLTALAVTATALLNCPIHTIEIFDGNKTYTVRSLTTNVAMVMKDIKLESQKFKVLKTETEDNTTSIQISYGFPVYITCGKNTLRINFCGGTVKDALLTAGFNPDKHDFVEPSINTEIKDTIYIDYTNIDYIQTTNKEPIPFKTKNTYTGELKAGTKKVVKEGKAGVKQVTYTEKIVNGVVVSKKATKSVTLTKAESKKVHIGVGTTKKNSKYISTLSPKTEITLDKNGVPVNYKSKMTVRATAYTHTGNRCSTGVKPQPGYIAVNPKVIPYGTKMFIKTSDGKYIYGYAVAADTGGFIKRHPTGIDLFFDTESECRKFGVRSAEIYILE